MAVLKSKGVFMAGRADGIFCQHLSHRNSEICGNLKLYITWVFAAFARWTQVHIGPEKSRERLCDVKAKKLSRASCM